MTDIAAEVTPPFTSRKREITAFAHHRHQFFILGEGGHAQHVPRRPRPRPTLPREDSAGTDIEPYAQFEGSKPSRLTTAIMWVAGNSGPGDQEDQNEGGLHNMIHTVGYDPRGLQGAGQCGSSRMKIAFPAKETDCHNTSNPPELRWPREIDCEAAGHIL